ncbi:RNA polymerase sigma factor [Olivibacter domesticus]|uniref:RNA polymerase sigma-70 factor, ECF subfamily n=1 Tax=Olivibacter domesticus TaxID=407022 RepID=A0A1H7R401_OLID1|nr:RNA polymerase sigma-70 factor [Olivibacter domesticus]SEL54970.1 RNA polymerase sigma-70 factor, ECF subfamily [Olivibacter domesticus]
MKAYFNPDESILIKKLAIGNEKAFYSLYSKYFKQIYSFVLDYVKSPDLAQDLCQEIFIKIWNDRTNMLEVRCFKAYLFTIARNHTLNNLRKVANSRAVIEEVFSHYPVNEKTTEDDLQMKEYQRYLQETLNSLTPTARRVFKLCREEQKTYDEVAKEMGVSRNAIKKHMVQTMKTLKALVEGPLEVHWCVCFWIFYTIYLNF